MAADTLTLILDGEVPLAEFARTIESFHELVSALSDDVGAPELDWILDDLQVSSAIATIRAPQNPQSAERVVVAYGEVGHSLETDSPITYSPRVRSAARRVISISDYRVKYVRFETQISEATIAVDRRPIAELEPSAEAGGIPQPMSKRKRVFAPSVSFGGLQGRIQVLSNGGGLRFTVYDLLYDKAVNCYIAEGEENLLRDAWGKLALVEGIISRDPITGRPFSIRQVRKIIPLVDLKPREYQDARGAVPLTGASPEERIRRLRDAQ